jgi:TonB family protein
MPQFSRFWLNLGLIAAAHVVLVVSLIHWSHEAKDATAPSIVWMSNLGGDESLSEKKSAPTPKPMKATPRLERTPEPSTNEEDERPVLTSARSDIQLPAPTASPARTPSPTSTSTPARTPQPSVPPKIKHEPKPTPKPTVKPSPKRIILAKASPKPLPKIKPTPEDENADENKTDDAKKTKLTKQEETPAPQPKEKISTSASMGKGTSPGGGRIGGAGNESRFGWYGSMLHDRFYSEWVQPTDVASGAKLSVLVRLRIETDGRVASFDIVRSSGNSELDESVKAIATRVTRVDPLPDGLAKGDHYDVKINFELNSE